MTVTRAWTKPVLVTSHVSGYAVGNIPPNINADYQKILSSSGIQYLEPDGDPHAFYERMGYLPVKRYENGGTGRSYQAGTASFKTKPDSLGRQSTRYIECDYLTTRPLKNGDPAAYAAWTQTDSRWRNLENLALSKAYEKIAEMDTSLSEAAYEARKTSDMILDAVKRLTTAAAAVRARRWKKAARALGIGTPGNVSRRKGFSDNWMEYRYGWMPIYLSTYGLMVALFNHMRRGNIRIIRGRSETRETRSKTASYSQAAGDNLDWSYSSLTQAPGGLSWVLQSTQESHAMAEAYFVVRYTNQYAATARSLGLTDPTTAWAILPFSWVADWFVDVTGFLTQLSCWDGKECEAHALTRYYVGRLTRQTWSIGSPNSSYVDFTKTNARYSESRWWTKRVIHTNPTFAGLTFGKGLNLLRVADAASLLRQALRK